MPARPLAQSVRKRGLEAEHAFRGKRQSQGSARRAFIRLGNCLETPARIDVAELRDKF